MFIEPLQQNTTAHQIKKIHIESKTHIRNTQKGLTVVATHAGLANSPEGCIQVRKLVQTIIHHRGARGNLVGQSVFHV